jgi:ParB-like chromosome segregation protein Spo0J
MSGNADSEPSLWLSGQLTGSAPSLVRVGSLNLDFSLRTEAIDPEHVRNLAGVLSELPPIVVHEPTGRVIDGQHRVQACLTRGQEFISAVLYHGSPDDAFAIAVRMNTCHGLPLSRVERSAAARQLLRTHPQWSNRMIAGMTGLSEATIRTRRGDIADPEVRSAVRVGQDGRVRPVSASDGRMRVSQLLAERPTASARTIAREAKVSTNTVLDVRRRLASGQEVLPAAVRSRTGPTPITAAAAAPGTTTAAVVPDIEEITESILGSLLADPSIRLSDRGRSLLRWLRANREVLNRRAEVVQAVPEHWSSPVARLARAYAASWQKFARELEYRQGV